LLRSRVKGSVFRRVYPLGVVASAPRIPRIPRRFNTGASLANPFAWNGRVDRPACFSTSPYRRNLVRGQVNHSKSVQGPPKAHYLLDI
jgi:hypothetical protein